MPQPHRSRVTVVIPVLDDAPHLARCLRALRRQDRVPDEVLVVDNGSRDDSARVAQAHGARVIVCEEPGIPAASAAGYDAASGDVLLRLDADCHPGPAWVRTMADAFDAHPGTVAVTGGARFADGPALLRGPLAAAYLLAYAAVMTPLLGHLPLFGSNLGIRASCWRDADLHDDLDLAFHVGERGRIQFVRRTGMTMSMRPFHSLTALRERARRGSATVLAHFPADRPPRRWRRLRAGARRQ